MAKISENITESRYTVVVSSCDSYSDLWDPFFRILKAEWPELVEKQIPIVLNTESKAYEYEDLNLRTMQLYAEGDNPSWTERLHRTLQLIDTDYVIFLLDDFFMRKRVQAEKINQHIKWMEDNPRISVFYYKETFASQNIRDNRYEGFERRPLIGKYKFNCQAALWRKKRLMAYLKKDETPWEWEVFGNWRSYRHPWHIFYSHIPGVERVFPYIPDENGKTFWESGIFKGRWCVPSVDDIFAKHGINVDYSIRGVVEEKELIESVRSEKKKEDAPQWKQMLWFIRPFYIGIKNSFSKIRYVLQHIQHFF